MMNIAIFGGSFNPPHKAHLRIAGEFFEKLSLDKMLIIPTFIAPHKDIKYYVSAEERLKMCRLMFPDDKFTVSDLEIKRQGKSYTIDTLEALSREYPGAKFYLIIGSDMLLSFHRWYRYEDILKKCTLCVMTRENSVTKGEMLWYAGSTLGLSERDMVLSDAGAYEMSSTSIREKIAKKEDVSDCLTKEVEDYIKEKGLYL
ncbi:MAG: nicotinate (nicotinamide) nucleotide adenylyltransferase [Acutalibacteraceae bacterium]